ncbi:Fic family protein [Roseivivax halotolerans]|uniref:Fic family protein n=1 Tax=Roseivivax halotolerans TaxID=93684 RepID=A0A1I6A726_9RHOB|nr:Fic/DOC family N-terminal domain-containing protein [Roseivivax halotolerans]SFQ64450.1 Fic family protein [Roseivivax halotolerans]
MRATDLSDEVKACLKHYPPPHSAHRGVVPARPSRGHIGVGGSKVGLRAAEAERTLARLTQEFHHSESAFALTRILERQEAVSSSSIEGTQSTLDALLEFEEDGDASDETIETRGVSIALDYGLGLVRKHGRNAFTVDLVLGLHARLAGAIKGFRGDPGTIREEVVWIGGQGKDPSTSTWNTPPPADVAECLEDTLCYMREEPEDQSQFSIIVRSAVAHAHFEAVHPFLDGNGRIGRLLVPMMFAANGMLPVYLSPWIEAYKSEYFEALKAAQQRLDHSPMIDLLARAIIGTEVEFRTTIAAVEEIESDWNTTLKLRKNSTAQRTLAILKSYPVLRAWTLADLLGVTFKAASDGLAQLERLGVVEERTGFSRNRIFASPAMLNVLTRPFGTDPDLHDHGDSPKL